MSAGEAGQDPCLPMGASDSSTAVSSMGNICKGALYFLWDVEPLDPAVNDWN